VSGHRVKAVSHWNYLDSSNTFDLRPRTFDLCLEGSTHCLERSILCLEGSTLGLERSILCVERSIHCLEASTCCLEGITRCLERSTSGLERPWLRAGTFWVTVLPRSSLRRRSHSWRAAARARRGTRNAWPLLRSMAIRPPAVGLGAGRSS